MELDRHTSVLGPAGIFSEQDAVNVDPPGPGPSNHCAIINSTIVPSVNPSQTSPQNICHMLDSLFCCQVSHQCNACPPRRKVPLAGAVSLPSSVKTLRRSQCEGEHVIRWTPVGVRINEQPSPSNYSIDTKGNDQPLIRFNRLQRREAEDFRVVFPTERPI